MPRGTGANGNFQQLQGGSLWPEWKLRGGEKTREGLGRIRPSVIPAAIAIAARTELCQRLLGT